ncbi:hypothetical protein A2U01_0058151, partial [Trifolium medium]|nr:hypothetical protein [Trifolium medium]
MDTTKENEIQALPTVQQDMDSLSQKGTEEIQPDPTQSRPEVEVPPTNEEPTPAQVELQGTPVIEVLHTEEINPSTGHTTPPGLPQNTAQPDIII